MDVNLLQLPWQIQIALGGGYLGYLAAYSGLREKHQQIDVAFRTVVFGLVASSVYGTFVSMIGSSLASIAGVLSSIALGLVWRGGLRDLVHRAVKRLSVSFVDDDPSALFTLSRDNQNDVSQVVVHLSDGSRLRCADTTLIANKGLNPLVIGADGSIAFYATHTYRKGSDGEEVETIQENLLDPDWGNRITIVPASQITRMSLRLKSKPPKRRSVFFNRWRARIARVAVRISRSLREKSRVWLTRGTRRK